MAKKKVLLKKGCFIGPQISDIGWKRGVFFRMVYAFVGNVFVCVCVWGGGGGGGGGGGLNLRCFISTLPTTQGPSQYKDDGLSGYGVINYNKALSDQYSRKWSEATNLSHFWSSEG